MAASPPALFTAGTPDGVLAVASGAARVLSDVIQQQQLYVTISGRRHVRVEGWTTCGALVGVFPHVEWCRRMGREEEVAYEARVSVRRVGSGEEIGSAEAMCSSAESRWHGRDENAIRSMAQTRATSKALRLPLAWIVTLAGYDATPAEEMDGPPPPSAPPEANPSKITVTRRHRDGTSTPVATGQPKRAVMALIARICGWENRHAVINGVVKHLVEIRSFTRDPQSPDGQAVEGALDEAARRTGIGTLDDLRQIVKEKIAAKASGGKTPPTAPPREPGDEEMPPWSEGTHPGDEHQP